MLLLGLTLKTVGELIIAVMVLMVHSREAHEHRIDRAVTRTITYEKISGTIGVILIVVGFALEAYFGHIVD